MHISQTTCRPCNNCLHTHVSLRSATFGQCQATVLCSGSLGPEKSLRAYFGRRCDLALKIFHTISAPKFYANAIYNTGEFLTCL